MSAKSKLAIEVEPARPRGRPTADDVVELEARLIRVARQVFVARGYGATSMNEVAKAARVSKTTLYSRFASKADLFRAIIDDQILRVGGALRQAGGAKSKSLEGRLRDFAEKMTRVSLSGEILQVNRLIYSEASRFPELGEEAWRRGRIGVQQIAELIEEYAVKDGVPCRDPQGAAELFILTLRGWYHETLLTSRSVSNADLKAVIDRILGMFLAARPSW
jgi:AcrR family transcriptional regulator